MPNASGLWNLPQQLQAQAASLWPAPIFVSWGNPTVFSSNSTSYMCGCSLQASGKVAIVFQDTNSNTLSIVGTISGTNITFGTAQTVNSFYVSSDCHAITYDSNAGAVVYAYRNTSGSTNDSYGCSKVGTPSGTSISWGSEVVFNSGTTRWAALSYSTTATKFVVSYQNSPTSADGVARVGTVSGSTMSYGTATTFDSGSVVSVASCFDSTNNAIGLLYSDVSTGYVKTIRGIISGTNISFGSSANFSNQSSAQAQNENTIAFNSGSGYAVGQHWYSASTDAAKAATISFASSTPTIGTLQTVMTNTQSSPGSITTIGGSNVLAVNNDTALSNYPYSNKGTISAGNVTFAGNQIVAYTANPNSPGPSVFYDSVTNSVVVIYRDGSNGYGYAIVGTVLP
jgi:hypothetical protein